jgi:hypothetical protein
LPQAMSAVESLIFERRVPPHVDQNNVITCCQIETWGRNACCKCLSVQVATTRGWMIPLTSATRFE